MTDAPGSAAMTGRPSSAGCVPRAACSPRTRRGCCWPRPRSADGARRDWSSAGRPGEPLEHVLGWAEFAGLRIAVHPGVFVPRRRTEALVEEAAGLAARRAPWCVDLCCGSGALGVAVGDAGSAASTCTPPTSTRRRSPARGVNVGRVGGRCTAATCSTALPRGAARTGGPAAGQRAVRAERRDRADAAGGAAARGRASRSTAGRTAWTSPGGWSPRRRPGWPRAAPCCSRRARPRRRAPSATVEAAGLGPGW